MVRQRWIGLVAVAAILFGAATFFVQPTGALFQAASPVGSPVATPGASPVGSPFALPVASPLASPVADSSGRAESVFASGPWRFTVVGASRAAAITALDLPAKAGRDWIVVIADVANWSSKSATLNPKDFGIRVTGSPDAGGFTQKLTEHVAAALSLEPASVDSGVKVAADKATRIALVFRIDPGASDPALAFNDDVLPLADVLGRPVSYGSLPTPSQSPTLVKAIVERVPDGSSITLGSGTRTLAGVDAPQPIECYGGQSTSRLKKLAGKQVFVETDDASAKGAYVWAEQADGSRKLINHELIAGGYAAFDPVSPAGPYATWLTDAERSAKASLVGLWERCTNQHGVGRSVDPEFTTLQLKSDGQIRPYAVWVAWSPLIVTTPDGGAWAFFSAEPTDGKDKGNKRLYAARFDPEKGDWSPALPMAGGKVQMGPSAVVDANGVVHLVFTDRLQDADGVFSVLMYTHEDGKGGWVKPIAVASDSGAGYQLSPSLSIDAAGGLHVVWQDQRLFAPEARTASAANADILASDLTPGGAWSPPVLVNTHFFDAVGSRPHIVADGDRLVAVWSVYAAALGIDSAASIQWSSRPIDDPNGWTDPQDLVVGRGENFGGKLVDLAADPTGGVVLAFGRQATDTFLFIRRLKPEATEWGGDTLLTYGDRGTFPSVAVAGDGTIFVTYNVGAGTIVDVGAVAIPFRSIVPGPEVILTGKVANTQGRPIVTTDSTGRPWIVYFDEPPGGGANAVTVLRNADVPKTVDTGS